MRSRTTVHRSGPAMLATFILVASVAVAPTRALAAWDLTPKGTVAALELDAYGGGFNVALTGWGSDLCTGAAKDNQTPEAQVDLGWRRTHAIADASAFGTADGVKAMYATLLAAKLSGQPVILFTNNYVTRAGRTICLLGAVNVP